MEKNNKFQRLGQTAHNYIINDNEVKKYLNDCEIPVEMENVELDPSLIHNIEHPENNSIEYIIACDSSLTTIPIKKSFPSSLITFYQFGRLLISRLHLDEMETKPFVSPSDIKKIKNIKRDKLVLPTKNVALKKEQSLKDSVRSTIHNFFKQKDSGGTSMLDTLFWFIFEEYDNLSSKREYKLSRCPNCNTKDIILKKSAINLDNYSWICSHSKCGQEIFLTDVFRLFEVVDNESGATGILSYTANLLTSFLLVHSIKSLLEIEEGLIDKFLLVKEGPLSFSGQTANMHRPMQKLLSFISKANKVNLIGVENSGAFTDHAKQIKNKLKPGQLFLLDNKHIYNYILPGNPESSKYGETSYYSGKMIYKSPENRVYVLTVPVRDHDLYYKKPEIDDLKNIREILKNIDRLRCDIYENALIPIALASKLISLTNHPSSNILEKFAKKTMNK